MNFEFFLMVDVAQLVEHWIVAPVVAGSSPVIHPILRSAEAELRMAQPSCFSKKAKDVFRSPAFGGDVGRRLDC